MADKPAAEVRIDEALVRRLVNAQAGEIPGTSTMSVSLAASGWDSEVWRLGDAFAVRLPRRALAAPLVLHEHRSLAVIGPALEETGVRVPTPIVRGAPGEGYPWAWSVVPWIDGVRGIDVERPERAKWSEKLAAALAALHVPAPADHPVNPVRGGPLATRAAASSERLASLTASRSLTVPEARALTEAWARGLAAPSWDRPPMWIHGDLHPGNLIADDGRLAGIIDFGDVTGGDPAYDLAVAWLAFEPVGRARFVEATGLRYDSAAWVRARAWAAAVTAMLLAHSDDEPDYATLGRSALEEIVSGS